MAVKFSEFEATTDQAGIDLVGTKNGKNVRINTLNLNSEATKLVPVAGQSAIVTSEGYRFLEFGGVTTGYPDPFNGYGYWNMGAPTGAFAIIDFNGAFQSTMPFLNEAAIQGYSNDGLTLANLVHRAPDDVVLVGDSEFPTAIRAGDVGGDPVVRSGPYLSETDNLIIHEGNADTLLEANTYIASLEARILALESA